MASRGVGRILATAYSASVRRGAGGVRRLAARPVGMAPPVAARAFASKPGPSGELAEADAVPAEVHPETTPVVEEETEVVMTTNMDNLEGYEQEEFIGLVSASDVRSKNVMKDILAAVGGMIGGETTYYSHLLNESTTAAMDKLVQHAEALGANAIVNVRFQTTTTMNRLIIGLHCSVLAYGTAIRVKPVADSKK